MANIIQTFPKGSGGGHTILDTDGTTVAQEKNLQFTGMSVTDDSQNELTEVAAEGLNEDSMADVLNGSIGNNFVTSGLNYSTDEQIVGRWIDGKPLYQKTINLGTVALQQNVQSNVGNISSLNIEKGFVVSLMAFENVDSYIRCYSLGYIDAWLRFNEGNIGLRTGNNGGYTGDIYITIQYTKTAD